MSAKILLSSVLKCATDANNGSVCVQSHDTFYTTEKTLLNTIEIQPVSGPVEGKVTPPGSKSITNRALIIAALAQGESILRETLASNDTHVMLDSLQRLNIQWSRDEQGTVSITGCGGKIPSSRAELWLENSGTSIRFLTALCALGVGGYELDGNSRMRQRPIIPLVKALRELGIDVHCLHNTDSPPVLVNSIGFPGGRVHIEGNLSSQYLSALLMVAPYASSPLEIIVEGELVSIPYIELTLSLMESFGVDVQVNGMQRFQITPQAYRAREYTIEPDASAASYFFAAAAVTGGSVTVPNLHKNALQGDIKFVDALALMGCTVEWGDNYVKVTGGELRGIDIDMNAISDTAQTLAAVAVFANGPTRVRNVEHMRYKETDRISAVVTELRRLGINVEEHPDGYTIHPGPITPASIKTYDDHRMAMSFSLIGLKVPGIVIEDPDCTAKTYPHFFDDLAKLCKN